MGFADILNQATASPYAKAAMLGTRILAGTRPSRTSSTSVPTVAPEYKTLGDLLRQRATERLNSSMDMSGYEANGISGINDAFSGVTQNANNSLTSRGLATSPVAGNVDATIQAARGSNIAQFLNTIPEIQRQHQLEDLNAAQGVFNAAPRTTTNSTVGADGGLSGGVQSAHEMLAYLTGKGLMGGGTIPSFGGGGGVPAVAKAGSQLLAPGIGELPSIAGIGAAAGGVPASAVAGSQLLAPGIGALPLPGAAGAAAPLSGYAGGGLITSHGALIGMLSNPITIGAAAAIIGVTALLKSQAHWEANTLVQNVQNPFNQQLSKIVDNFDSAYQSGRLNKATAQQMRDATAGAISQYTQALSEFEAKGGKDNVKVVSQARADMAKYFGPNWEGILGKMDQEIAGLR